MLLLQLAVLATLVIALSVAGRWQARRAGRSGPVRTVVLPAKGWGLLMSVPVVAALIWAALR